MGGKRRNGPGNRRFLSVNASQIGWKSPSGSGLHRGVKWQEWTRGVAFQSEFLY